MPPATKNGRAIDKKEPIIETPISPVLTAALPVPSVNLDEPNRSRDVPACITPAVPPPTISPSIHCQLGSNVIMLEALMIMSDNTAVCRAIVSKMLSKNGI